MIEYERRWCDPEWTAGARQKMVVLGGLTIMQRAKNIVVTNFRLVYYLWDKCEFWRSFPILRFSAA